MLTSRDGYCTIVIFDQVLPAHHTQQHSLQLQSITTAHHNHTHSSSSVSASGSGHAHGHIPNSAAQSVANTPAKRSAPLPSPVIEKPTSGEGLLLPPPSLAAPSTASAEDDSKANVESIAKSSAEQAASSSTETKQGESATAEPSTGPPKKKRRVALTRVGNGD